MAGAGSLLEKAAARMIRLWNLGRECKID